MEYCTQIIEEISLCLRIKYRKLEKGTSKHVIWWGNVGSTSFTELCRKIIVGTELEWNTYYTVYGTMHIYMVFTVGCCKTFGL